MKTISYIHNALGERSWKSSPGVGDYRYIYADQNNLLSEHQDNGDVWTNYLYFGKELVGVVRDSKITYLHVDHLGRPEVAAIAAKVKVWYANNYAFERGGVYDTIGGMNLGFPRAVL